MEQREAAEPALKRTRDREPAARDEEQLVERLKSGDHQALEAIFRLHSNKVFQLAYKLTRDRTESEEVVQDVFLTVYQKVRGFRGGSRFSTWLYRLTVNAALGRLRRKKRSKEVSYEDFLPQFQPDGHHLERPVVDWSNDVETRSSGRELQDLLTRALNQLRPQDKAVVVLSDLEGLRDQEIAKTLGLSVAAVKTRLHRARLFLRGQLAVHLGYSPT
ncbi:MAG: sigma-70 family RNA polymerase sigma factor [Deltaproteobacteria bacterium]|nr:sigma-70 family RNA polymerase sigma factor [Deltaproteobacteria bacterium]